MKKVAIVFWSGTGNTEEMANSVMLGAKEAGAEVSIFTASEFSADLVNNYDSFAFGCPSMGDEVLEESEFQPMWDKVLPALTGKTVALFGAYDWGDGQWMRDWESDCKKSGINLATNYIISNEQFNDKLKNELENMGKNLSE